MASVTNPTAYASSHRGQRYTGEVLPPAETDIVAEIRGQLKYTIIYFPPTRLNKIIAKYGRDNLIFLKNVTNI